MLVRHPGILLAKYPGSSNIQIGSPPPFGMTIQQNSSGDEMVIIYSDKQYRDLYRVSH